MRRSDGKLCLSVNVRGRVWKDYMESMMNDNNNNNNGYF